MMSPILQRLSNTWLLPITLLVMSPVIIYEQIKGRNDRGVTAEIAGQGTGS